MGFLRLVAEAHWVKLTSRTAGLGVAVAVSLRLRVLVSQVKEMTEAPDCPPPVAVAAVLELSEEMRSVRRVAMGATVLRLPLAERRSITRVVVAPVAELSGERAFRAMAVLAAAATACRQEVAIAAPMASVAAAEAAGVLAWRATAATASSSSGMQHRSLT